MMRMYTDDTPGIKVYESSIILSSHRSDLRTPPIVRDPVAVLVMSLIFIGSVFILHIWGKYTRSSPAASSA